MKPRNSLITLGVDDLKASLVFSRDGLGLVTQRIAGEEFEHGAVVFFDLQAGPKLALWPRASLAHDADLARSERSATEFALAHNVATREEVNAVMAQARRAGATIVKPAQPAFWDGYSGHFQDPDDHLWEVAWNPPFDMAGQTALFQGNRLSLPARLLRHHLHRRQQVFQHRPLPLMDFCLNHHARRQFQHLAI